MQTVIYECVVTLTKMLSPILSHTADEIWKYIPGVEEENVQLTDIPEYKELPNARRYRRKMDETFRTT